MQEKCESFSNLCFIEFAQSQQNPSLPFKLSATCIIFVKGVLIYLCVSAYERISVALIDVYFLEVTSFCSVVFAFSGCL